MIFQIWLGAILCPIQVVKRLLCGISIVQIILGAQTGEPISNHWGKSIMITEED